MPTDRYIGVDVGGGGIRVRADLGGQLRTIKNSSPVPRARGQIDIGVLAERIGALLAPIHRGEGVHAIAVGLTGMPGLLGSPAEFAHHLHSRLPVRDVYVASDALTTHLGALRGHPGCVVAAGTGVIVLGTDHRQIWNQADGWGHLLGDDGGGAWIGAQGLQAALRHHDRRDEGSAALSHQLRQRYGDTDKALSVIYGAGSPAHELAAFAPHVADAARQGDRVALGIWRKAGARLASATHAAARSLPPDFSWGGKLFDAEELLHDPFKDELERRIPEARTHTPAGTAADGALLLARRGLPAKGFGMEAYAAKFSPPGCTVPIAQP